MIFARNAIVFTIDGLTTQSLQDVIASRPFHPCEPFAASSEGFVAPAFRHPEILVWNTTEFAAIALRIDSKILPASVVQAETNRRIDELKEHGEKVFKKFLKEEVTDDLLRTAFIRTTLIRAWIDFVRGLLVVDTSSPGKAEKIAQLIFNANYGKCRITRWRVKSPPSGIFTRWVNGYRECSSMSIDDHAVLENRDTGAQVRINHNQIASDDVSGFIKKGTECIELTMTLGDRISFTINDKLTIKRLKLLGIKDEAPSEQDDLFEDHKDNAIVEMNASSIRWLFDALNEELGGQQLPEPLKS